MPWQSVSIVEVRAMYPPCGAWSRSRGRPCRNIPVKGRARCFLHGGRAGAPKGTQSRLTHGRNTAAANQERRAAAAQARAVRDDIKAVAVLLKRPRGRPKKIRDAPSNT
jgi:hypothetical protein